MSKDKDEEGKTIQAMGGDARRDALSEERRREIASNAAKARWSLPRATHEGRIALGGVEIECCVLGDGRRLITQSGFMRALGRARQAKGRAHYSGDVNLPAFLTAKNLKPFISKDLEVTSSQVEFVTQSGVRAFGYPSDLLPLVCDVFMDAEEAGVLVPGQVHVARQAKLLARGLIRVGVAALIDEATGYQDVRDRQALQAILDAYLAKEFAAWAKRFPDEFYQQIFRLKGWEWRGMKVNRPGVVGKYTNDIVYARLGPGVLDELRKRNPPNERGNRKAKHHQWLTNDLGHPALERHIHAVVGLMRAASTWTEFHTLLNRAFKKDPKVGETYELPFPT